MARSRNLLGLHGKVGQLCIYTLNGKEVVRTVGQVPKSRYKHDKAFARMRENNSEFGGASQIGAVLRRGLQPYVKRMGDAYVSGRLNGKVRQIMMLGMGQRGERSFRLLPNGGILQGFSFEKAVPLASVFGFRGNGLTTNALRNEVTLHVEGFDPKASVVAPKGATGFRLVLVCVAVSDYVYADGYVSVVAKFNGVNGHAESGYLPLDAITSAFNLSVDLGLGSALPTTCGIVCALGIEFYQAIGSELYRLEGGHAMGVVGVV